MNSQGTVRWLTAAAGLAGRFFALAATLETATPFPRGYRRTGGIFHFYANDLAMEGYRTGNFADGSILADEFLETRGDSEGAAEGPRRGVGVMVKDSQRYGATGGWGFGAFAGENQTQDTYRPRRRRRALPVTLRARTIATSSPSFTNDRLVARL